MLRRADLHESNHQLESRVREIRLPGSEGGAILISRPYPYPARSTDRHLRLTRMGERPDL